MDRSSICILRQREPTSSNQINDARHSSTNYWVISKLPSCESNKKCRQSNKSNKHLLFASRRLERCVINTRKREETLYKSFLLIIYYKSSSIYGAAVASFYVIVYNLNGSQIFGTARIYAVKPGNSAGKRDWLHKLSQMDTCIFLYLTAAVKDFRESLELTQSDGRKKW